MQCPLGGAGAVHVARHFDDVRVNETCTSRFLQRARASQHECGRRWWAGMRTYTVSMHALRACMRAHLLGWSVYVLVSIEKGACGRVRWCLLVRFCARDNSRGVPKECTVDRVVWKGALLERPASSFRSCQSESQIHTSPVQTIRNPRKTC